MANLEGDFSIQLPCGTYSVVFQSLGYRTEKRSIEISPGNSTDYKIVLEQIAYKLERVDIDPSSEDPAYNIIRKATVMAQLFKKQITAYTTKLYIRQFYEVNNIPFLMEMTIPEEDLKEAKTGNISETLLEYSYERPSTVREKIIARKTGDNDTSKTGSNYINLNFYDIGRGELINPLSRGAFQVYKFEHINSYFEGDQKVHKIEIIPRRKGNDLMEGYLHINDGIWNINKVNVKFKQTGAKLEYIQFYNEVEDLVWMPVNHKIKVDVSIVGIKGKFQYLATLSELNVQADSTVNGEIRASLNLRTGNPTKADSASLRIKSNNGVTDKTQQKINELIQKEKLTNKETYKLVRLLKKQSSEERKEDTASANQSLEVKRNYTLTYDDSAFTSNVKELKDQRDIPLTDKEKSIYVARDSLSKVEKGDTVINKKRGVIGSILFYDGGIQSENKRRTFRPNGILTGISGYFNTVDGTTLYKSLLSYNWNNKKGKFYNIEPVIGYAFSREQLLGKLNFNGQYDMKKRAGFKISVGRVTSDFNSHRPMSQLVNTVATLVFTENYPKFYQSEYAEIEHHIDLANGLVFNTKFRFDNRERLFNRQSYNIIDVSERDYTSNSPGNENILNDASLIEDNKSSVADISLSYTHRQRYRYSNDRKVMLSSNYPTLELNYLQGIKGLFESEADFNLLSVAISQRFAFRRINQIRYQVEAGKFLNNDRVFFADFKNFNTSPFYVRTSNAINSFNLLDYYAYNTNKEYLQGHFSVEDNHILLKKLPLLNSSSLTEKFSINYLLTDRSINYYEFGYSLNRILLFINLGVYVSFEDDEFDQLGFRLGVDTF